MSAGEIIDAHDRFIASQPVYDNLESKVIPLRTAAGSVEPPYGDELLAVRAMRLVQEVHKAAYDSQSGTYEREVEFIYTLAANLLHANVSHTEVRQVCEKQYQELHRLVVARHLGDTAVSHE